MSKISQNLKDNFMGSMSGKIAAGALAFTAAFLPMTGKLGNTFDGIANAQDIQPVKHHREMTALEKDDAARRFSIHNEGVGVFVNFAAVPEMPHERFIRATEINFAKVGIPVHIETNVSRGNLTTFTFFLKGTPFGGPSGDGYDVSELDKGFETIVKAFRQEQAKKVALPELHSSIR
jgi:hypothetical protein